MKKLNLILCLVFIICALQTQAQTAAESSAIKKTALDYIEGWYSGDGQRMEREVGNRGNYTGCIHEYRQCENCVGRFYRLYSYSETRR